MPPQTISAVPRRRSLESASVWALIATLVIAVLVFIPSSSIPFLATKAFVLAGGALITLVLYILARLSRGNLVLPPLALLGALWLPVVAYLLSALFSGGSFANAFWGTALGADTLGFFAALAVLGSLAMLVVRRSEQYRSFLSAIGATIGVVAVIEVLIVLAGQLAPNSISPALSIVGSYSDLAALLGLGVIGALLTLRFVEVPSRVRLALIIGGALSLFLLAIANSALVWVLVALVSLGLFVEAVMKRRSYGADADVDGAAVVDETPAEGEAGNKSLVLPLVVLALSLFFLIGSNLGGALANALHVNILNVRPSWQSTLSTARSVYASEPFFGSGPASFATEWLKYRNASLNSTLFWNVGFASGIGSVPTSLVTTGIAGALAWLALFGLLLWYGFRTLIRRAPEDPFMRYVAMLTFVGAVYLFAIAIFSVPGMAIFALAFVAAGLFASASRYAAGSKQVGIIFARSPRLGFVIVFTLTLLLLGSVVAAYPLVERYVATAELTRATAAASAGNLDAAEALLASANAFAPSAAAYQLQANISGARVTAVVASTSMSATDAQSAFQSALSTGVTAALTATQLDPDNYANWMVLGNLYAQAVPLKIAGAYDSAKQAYEKAKALAPTNPQIPFTMAQLDIANSDLASATADLQAAIALKQDYTDAIFLLSQVQVQAGNVKDALAAAEAAAYFTPNDPNILFQVGVLRAAQSDLPGAVQALSAAVSANAQFANARYFLAAVYAKQNDLTNALAQVKAIAAISEENAAAVASLVASLEEGKNPFPANLLSISSTPTDQTSTTPPPAK
jgi:tetratricopeptide (TPR) repeat protein